ncbi:helix-turn-helix domain-containing protein [Bdellovibrio sp. KM01]|uniref:winged helix-turn-helix transcriptional regulator n=1 Tax=Bdellovibrio sp. KM01 TaxID=2748865 RepID=UPI0015EAE7BD|nr:helix-turn-helix domain-containing protein [Bdellovibrio sp. KM01]QLY27407.1 helix-turn-helix transcriptional regulator [Bdellovibrio sp. KM01]
MKKVSNKRNIQPNQLCNNVDADGVRELMNTVGDKWSVFIIVALQGAPGHRARFSELERLVRGISQKMLSSTLKKLERDGIVAREVFPEIPPRVEYQLSSLGLSLYTIQQALVCWVADNWNEVKKSRARADKLKM